MADRKDVWAAFAEYPRADRGFDDETAWWPHFAAPAVDVANEADVSMSRPPLEEDVRGSFAAIAELAGFWARVMPCNPADGPGLVECVLIARTLEDMARGLRLALLGLDEIERNKT